MQTPSTSFNVGAKVHWPFAILTVLVVQALMVVAAFAWVAIYAYGIHPGEAAAYYEAYAQVASPISALITGPALYYLAARWLRRRLGESAVSTALVAAGIAVALDIAVTVTSASIPLQWWLCLVNAPLKAAALWFGVRARA